MHDVIFHLKLQSPTLMIRRNCDNIKCLYSGVFLYGDWNIILEIVDGEDMGFQCTHSAGRVRHRSI